MQWLSNFEGELELAFTKAENILAKLPVTFNRPALAYLDKFHVLKDGRSKNYICYLLPYWLGEHVEVHMTDSQNFAVANIFGMMYYHLIDEMMDEQGAKSTQQLPLANLIHLEFIQIYNGYFPAESPFWYYFKKYITEWAEAVTHEQHQDYFHEKSNAIAHKAAPVKLSIVSSILLTGEEDKDLITQLEDAVDTVLVTLQMVDDWQDWKKDLQEGSYNCLISMVQSQLHIPKDRRPTHAEIEQALYSTDLLLRYAERAESNHETLEAIKPIVPYLYQFHGFLCDNVKQAARQIEAERQLLQQGGLAYWLSKNI
jgi:hypothetical protein